MPNEGTVTLAIVAKNLTEAELNAVKTGLSDLNIKVNSVNTPLTQTGGLMGKLNEHFSSGEGSIRRLSTGLAFGAIQMTGMNSEAARLTEGLLLFGGGHGAVLVAAAAVAAIAGIIKLATTDFSEHGKHVAELEKRYSAMATEMDKMGNAARDVVDLQELVGKTVAKAGVEIEKQNELALGNGEVWIQTDGTLRSVGDDTDAAIKQFKELNAALAKAEEPATNLQQSLEAQVIGFQKGRDEAELFKTGILQLDPALAENIRQLQAYVSAQKITSAAKIHHLELLVREGTTIGFTTEQVDAFRIQLVRAQAAQEGLNAQETEAKVKNEEETLALTKLYDQQKKVNDARQKAIELFDTQAGQRAKGEGPLQTSSEGGVASEPTGPETEVFRTLDQIDVKLTEFDAKNHDVLGRFSQAVGDNAGAWKKLRDMVANGIPVKEATAALVNQLNEMHEVTQVLSAGFESLFQGIVSGSGISGKAFLHAMASMAASKAAFEFGEGLAALATAIFPGIPGAGVAAANHFKAAAIFGALAIGFSAASGGGGSSSGSPAGSTLTGPAGANAPAARKGDIYIQGGVLDMTNPDQADAFAKAYKELVSRGITEVTVHPA